MSLTTIVTQFALTVGASLAERIASALSARIKQEPEPEANPVDIAIATKSAVSADREGKIASMKAEVDARFERMLRDTPREPIGHVARVKALNGRHAELDITSNWNNWNPKIGVGDTVLFCDQDGCRANDKVRVQRELRSVDVPTTVAYVKFDAPIEHGATMVGWYVFIKRRSVRRLGDYGPGGE